MMKTEELVGDGYARMFRDRRGNLSLWVTQHRAGEIGLEQGRVGVNPYQATVPRRVSVGLSQKMAAQEMLAEAIVHGMGQPHGTLQVLMRSLPASEGYGECTAFSLRPGQEWRTKRTDWLEDARGTFPLSVTADRVRERWDELRSLDGGRLHPHHLLVLAFRDLLGVSPHRVELVSRLSAASPSLLLEFRPRGNAGSTEKDTAPHLSS